MAEIHVEKNKKPIWPWILGLLLVGAIIWLIADTGDDRENEVAAYTEQEEMAPQETAPEQQMTQTQQTEPEVEQYLSFVDSDAEMGLDHEYTSEGLMHLREALASVAEKYESVDARQQLAEMEQISNEIQQDPTSTQHADKIKAAFMAASNVLYEIQQSEFPDKGEDVENMRETARNLDASELTLDQKDQVKQFFEQAGEALRSMSDA